MRFGIWTPLPHTIRSEPRMERAIEALKGGSPDRDPMIEGFDQFAQEIMPFVRQTAPARQPVVAHRAAPRT